MKLGLITDIHEQVEVLSIALDVLRDEAVDMIVLIGDVVGDGPAPRQQVAEHRLGLFGLEVAQVEALVIDGALAPLRTPDQHLGAGAADDHDRRAAQARRQVEPRSALWQRVLEATGQTSHFHSLEQSEPSDPSEPR